MLPFPWSRAHASINHNINTIIILPPGTKDYAKASKAPRRPACSARRGLAVHGDWRGAPAAVSIGEGGEGSRLTSRNEPRARPRATACLMDGSIAMACLMDAAGCESATRVEGWRPPSGSGYSAAGPRGARALSVTHVSGRPPRPTTASDPPWLPMTWWGRGAPLAFSVLLCAAHRTAGIR